MKKAIVLASFGTTDETARQRAITSIADEIQTTFPAYQVVEAYTSRFVLRRLQARGVEARSLPDCLTQLLTAGVQEIYIQPAHLTPGEEYDHKICTEAATFAKKFTKLVVGEPLFFHWQGYQPANVDDVQEALKALAQCFTLAQGEQLVLLGHGSPHRHNPVYEALQRAADEASLPFSIGVVEKTDWPRYEDVEARLLQAGTKQVLLAPLLLTGGVHVTEDMAGADESSWKSRLEKRGFQVRVDKQGLGERAPFRQLYLQKVKRLVLQK